MRRMLFLLFTLGVPAWGRELNELEGIVYSQTIQPYAEAVAPDVQLPPPLKPELFSDPEIRRLYQASSTYRNVVIQLPCYCACHVTAGHKSLYACYVAEENSACYSAKCEICLDELKIAVEMLEKGGSVEDIRAALAAKYGGM